MPGFKSVTLVMALGLGLSRANAQAQSKASTAPVPPEVQLSEPRYAGSGCPEGSVGAVLSPDQNEVSLLFDQFLVEVGAQKARASKGCRILMELKINNGNYRLRVDDVDLRGAVILPAGSVAALQARHAITATGRGMRNPRNGSFTRAEFRFNGPIEEDFVKVLEPIDRGLPRHVTHYTRCDDAFYVSMDATLSLVANKALESALLSLDTVDASYQPNVTLNLDWASCRGEPVGRRKLPVHPRKVRDRR